MKYFIRGLFLSLVMSLPVMAQTELLDKVAVIVDQGVVLESEVRALVNEVKADAAAKDQRLPSDEALRTQAIERLILKNLQLQMAERMGIRVSDPQLDQTIANIAAGEGATVEQLRDEITRQGIAPQELVKSNNSIRRVLKKALKAGPRTIPQLTEETEMASADVLWHVVAMLKYGTVVEAGLEEEDEEYYLYALSEAKK